MTKKKSTWLGGFTCLLGLQHAQAATIATVDFALSVEVPLVIPGPSPVADEVILYFAYSLIPGGLEDLETRIFDGGTIGPGDSGRIITLSSAVADPQFDVFLERLTNGVDDDLRVIAVGPEGGGGGFVAPESTLWMLAPGFSAPDVAGALVTGLELELASVFINPEAGVGQINWNISGELHILGEPMTQVPVPAAGWLLAAPWLWLLRYQVSRARF